MGLGRHDSRSEARRFRGARLSTLMPAYLREDNNKVNKQNKSENP
jgi:hypothetical protein